MPSSPQKAKARRGGQGGKIIACEQALHLGDIVKSTRARGTREETRQHGLWVQKNTSNEGLVLEAREFLVNGFLQLDLKSANRISDKAISMIDKYLKGLCVGRSAKDGQQLNSSVYF